MWELFVCSFVKGTVRFSLFLPILLEGVPEKRKKVVVVYSKIAVASSELSDFALLISFFDIFCSVLYRFFTSSASAHGPSKSQILIGSFPTFVIFPGAGG